MAPDPRYPDASAAANAGGAQAPGVGFDGVQQPQFAPPAGYGGVQQPQLGSYPPADGKVVSPSGYPSVAPVGQQLPHGYPGAPPPGPGTYLPAGAPPPPGGLPPHSTVGLPMGGVPPAGDKIGPLGITAWVLFVIGIIFPISWVVACFLPLCARRGAKGPKDALAVRRAAIASSAALCVYLVLMVVLVSMGSTKWKRNICVDRNGNQFYC